MPTGIYKRKPFTTKHKKSMSKNHSHFWLGKKQSQEHKEKISNSLIGNTRSLGFKQSTKHILKSRIMRRINGWWKDSDLTQKRQSESKKGKKRQLFSKEWLENLSKSKKANNHWNWQSGITPENDRIRHSFELKYWRNSVFERDNYTCAICRNRGVYLEAHHVKKFSEYPELRFDINNGITLCKKCHNETKGKEELYEKAFVEKGGKFITCDGRVI